MESPSWRYRLTPEALIEEIDGRIRVYGRWDRSFGCWDLESEDGTWREAPLAWPVLGPLGVWLAPEAIRGPHGHPARASWRFEARAAHAAYFSLIPVRVRILVSPLGESQWEGLRRIWQDADLLRVFEDMSLAG